MDLTKSPYNLSQSDINWVEKTLEGMTLREKVGQLFLIQGFVDTPNIQKEIIETITPGGFLFRSGTQEELKKSYNHIAEISNTPLFLAGITENGASGVVKGGITFGNNVLIGATNDSQNAYSVSKIIGEEVNIAGTNMVLDPVIDIDKNWRCAVTNVRAFGDNESIVSEMAIKYIEGLKASGVESVPRHFPGLGVDERNPTLIPTVNDLEYNEWKNTYGKVYQDIINSGVKSLLVSTILLPNVVKHIKPDATKEEIEQPANLSPIIINDLLKGELGFNGVVISDSTLTAAFNSRGKREELLPKLIESGCDMFLFTKDYLEDYISILKGCKSGVIKNSRLNEAVTKILALKASMKLHLKNNSNNYRTYINHDSRQFILNKLSDEGITLVKDETNILPISSEKTKKVLVIYLDKSDNVLNAKGKTLKDLFNERLEEEGFEIVERNYSIIYNNIKYMNENIETFKETVDLVIYISNVQSSSLRNSTRINYKSVLGLDTPWFVKEVPTIFISLSSPYHMYDMPMISTFINAYYATEEVILNVIDKLVGRTQFKGVSPVRADFDIYGKQVDNIKTEKEEKPIKKPASTPQEPVQLKKQLREELDSMK